MLGLFSCFTFPVHLSSKEGIFGRRLILSAIKFVEAGSKTRTSDTNTTRYTGPASHLAYVNYVLNFFFWIYCNKIFEDRFFMENETKF